jgi:hypothetical protein
MTNHEVFSYFRISTKCSWRNLVKFLKRNLICIRLHLNKGKNEISMVITHEQGVLTRVLRLNSLELILVPFSRILELSIINYELITNSPRLTIKTIINN